MSQVVLNHILQKEKRKQLGTWIITVKAGFH